MLYRNKVIPVIVIAIIYRLLYADAAEEFT